MQRPTWTGLWLGLGLVVRVGLLHGTSCVLQVGDLKANVYLKDYGTNVLQKYMQIRSDFLV